MNRGKIESVSPAGGRKAAQNVTEDTLTTLVAVRAAEPLLYRVSMAMEKLSVSRAIIYRLAASGDLTLVKVGKRASGITADSIRALIERGVVQH
jgi:hypothetical protein